VIGLPGISGEQPVALGEGLELRGPKGAGGFGAEAKPEGERTGPGGGMIPREAECPVGGEECVEDLRAVEVMNALEIAFLVSVGGELLDEGEAVAVGKGERVGDRRRGMGWVDLRLAGGARGCGEARGTGGARGVGVGLEQFEEAAGEVLATIDVAILGEDFLIPQIACRQEVGVGDRSEIAGAGQVQVGCALVVDDREVEGLGIDVKPVFAKPDRVGQADEQFLPVFQLPRGVLLHALETTLEVVGFDGVFEGEQLSGDLADLGDHQVRGHVGMDCLEGLEPGQPILNDLEDTLGGGHQGAGAAVALLDQGELALFEGLVECGAAVRELDGVFLEIGEGSLEFLELDGDAVEVFVALGGGIAEIEVTGGGLAEELELGGELGGAFGGGEVLEPVFERRSDLVQGGVDCGDAIDDAGGLGGVLEAQAIDDLDQQFEFGAGGGDRLLDLSAFGDACDLVDGDALGVGLAVVGGERLRLEEELGAGGGQFVILGDEGLLRRLDLGQVDVADVFQGDDFAAELAQGGEVAYIIIESGEVGAADRVEPFFAAAPEVFDAENRLALETAHFVELVDRLVGHLANVAEGLVQFEAFRMCQPRIGVEHGTGAFDKVGVKLGVRILAADESEDFVDFGQETDHLFVAHLVEKGVALAGWLVAGQIEGGLAQLNGVVFLRFGIGPEQEEMPVREEAESVATDAFLDFLGDEPVGHEDVKAAQPMIEHVEGVFASGRMDDALEDKSVRLAFKPFQLAGGEVIAVGEDQPMALGQEGAGLPERIDADDGSLFFIEDEEAGVGFAIGADLEEDQVIDHGVGQFGVIDLLEAVFDRFGVDSLARSGVVFDLDGEIAADAFHEDAIGDGDVGMVAVAVGFAGGDEPAELVRRWIADPAELGFCAAVDEAQSGFTGRLLGGRTLVGDDRVTLRVVSLSSRGRGGAGTDPGRFLKRPFEDGEVIDSGSGGELHVEVAADHGELPERGALVDMVKALEIGEELRISQRLQSGFLEGTGSIVTGVDGEHVVQIDFLFQSELDVESEEEAAGAELDHVAGQAVVGGGDAIGLEEFELDRAEDVLASGIELGHAFAQGDGLGLEPLADDLVGCAAERRRGTGRRRRGCGGGRGCGGQVGSGRVRHGHASATGWSSTVSAGISARP